ncbi:glycine betaine ABC transporter substrate-binding protein [Synechococcus sp. CBW1108]|uniref:glycine betaine ABC transporter substrate-binding protein n=1 Tax=Synechococcus sp. CBW1108 TaxID=1353147 RepID=UPI0018CFC432|nr:glycine betaine ABC transporter substrate-binding protein [Synechococcus sp. CBW1108]QPN71260.1 glycine betaine ABC transporter substrate-binding protein [Synechococcus sp. CBW1108]
MRTTPQGRWLARLRGLAALGLACLAMAYVVRLGDDAPVAGAVGGAATTTAGSGGVGRASRMRLGWTSWADAEVVSLLVERLLERRLGLDVERVMADIGIQYEGVARGHLDLMLMAWLPETHRSYWNRVRTRVVDLGPIYTGRLGWVVPERIPAAQLGSIEDLRDPAVAARLGGRIQGIDPGSGLMQASERALEAYGLQGGLQLVPASGAAMTAVLERAMRSPDAWVVVTAWRPHWIFARHELRFLDDPRGVLGRRERIHAVARRGFDRDFPEVVDLLARFHLEQNELADLLLAARDSSPRLAVEAFLQAHPRRVAYWVNGQLEETTEAAQAGPDGPSSPSPPPR